MMDVDQAVRAMKEAEIEAEIEDFLEGFHQPAYRGMRAMASGSLRGRLITGGPGPAGQTLSSSNKLGLIAVQVKALRPFRHLHPAPGANINPKLDTRRIHELVKASRAIVGPKFAPLVICRPGIASRPLRNRAKVRNQRVECILRFT
jgi:hypothetical protein